MKREATRNIGAVIADYVQESKLGEGLLQARVCAAWDALVISQVALRDYTARCSFRDGVLSCKMRSSVVRSHLQLQTGLLCERLNALLQGDYVKTIRLM